MLPCFIPFLSDLNSFSHQHFYCDSCLFRECCSKISYFLLCQVFHCFDFFNSGISALFFDLVGSLLIVYCSDFWLYLLILVALLCILWLSSSRTTLDPFFLILFFCSIILYFSFLLISPRFVRSKMLICLLLNQFTSSTSPVDTGRKLNVHKTFRRRPGLYVQFTSCVYGEPYQR